MQQSMVRAAQRRRARGVTLFEVLIVVAILALISSGVAFAAFAILERVKVREAEKSARVVRASVKAWWALQNDPGCPSVDELIREGILDRDSTRADPWGQAWRVECVERDVTIVSLGPDRKVGTEDDIRIPPV
jgi:general secretion pathway protein G